MEGSTRNMNRIINYANRYHDTTKRFQGFSKLFMVWKGSVAKLIWHDLAIFLFLYYLIRIIYRHILIKNDASAQYFEMFCIYAGRYFLSI